MTAAVAAVDLGATSGRVMLGRVGPDELSLTPLARFLAGGTYAGWLVVEAEQDPAMAPPAETVARAHLVEERAAFCGEITHLLARAGLDAEFLGVHPEDGNRWPRPWCGAHPSLQGVPGNGTVSGVVPAVECGDGRPSVTSPGEPGQGREAAALSRSRTGAEPGARRRTPPPARHRVVRHRAVR